MARHDEHNPSDLAAHPALTVPGTFVAVVGPSGAGKDSVMRGAQNRLDPSVPIEFARRIITRPTEPNEDHEAVDVDEFAARRSAGGFAIEWVAHGLHYALSSKLFEQIAAGRSIVANVSREVIAQVRDVLPRVVVVSIEAPPEVLAARLAARGREDAADQLRRLARRPESIAADVRIDNAGPLEDAVTRFEEVLRSLISVPGGTVPRFAIYLAPSPESPLWDLGSRVIGYDAVSGRRIATFAPSGFEAAEWTAATHAPRLYGFHATLKAPFRLQPRTSVAALDEALAQRVASAAAFDLPPLVLHRVGQAGAPNFVALVPSGRSEALSALEWDVVQRFDSFRAPLTAIELSRRKPHTLTERQRHLLDRYGYPFVHDEFRCHFTLTGAIARAEAAEAHLTEVFASPSVTSFRVDALVLFAQSAPDVPFRVLKRYPFAG